MTERADPPLSRAELLAGLSGRRVSTALYAVEARTAHLAELARYATAPAIAEGVTQQRERAFLAALAGGRELSVAPTAQQLERYASGWVHLVPADAAGRAALAERLGAKYALPAAEVPRLRAALGLDTEPVRAAYRERHGRELDAVFAPPPGPAERLAWRRARLARRVAELPPFWAAFGLTLTETVGAGTLALPIALAGIGPLPGVALIAVLGLVNVLTIAALAETFTRSGSVRWGGAYLARLVRELLGPAASVVFTAGLFAFCLVALPAYYVGFATTLEASSGIGAPLWAAVLFVAILLLLARGGIGATVASALAVGAVKIGAILLLSALALGRADPANLLHADVPLVDGGPLDPAVLGLVFGVVLFAFFGHTSVANCARVVLHRDPGGRSLVAGAAVATVTAIAVYALWVVAVGGAVAPRRLAAELGTALVPLAEVLGGPVLVVGAVFAVLAMGMAAVHFSWGMVNQLREWTRGAYGVALLPVAAVFVVVEALLLTGRESFTGQVGVLGTATLPLLAGVFPVLLLAAARRRGECLPAWRAARLGGAGLAVALYALFLGALAVHGLVIWQHPAQRALALGLVAVVGLTTLVVLREHRLTPRVTVVLGRAGETGRLALALTEQGHALAAPVRSDATGAVPDGRGEREVPAGALTVELAVAAPRSLVVRLHELDPAGRSVPLPGRAVLDGAALDLTEGIAEADLAPGRHELRLEVGP